MGRPDIAATFHGGPGFTLYHAFGPHGRLPQSPHFHDDYLICAQLRGHEVCRVGRKTLEFFAGDLVFINPEQVHTGNSRGEEVEYVSLYVDRAKVAEMAAALGAPTTTPEFTVVRAARRRDLGKRLIELLGEVRRQAACGDGGTDPASALSVEAALDRVLVAAFSSFSNLREPRIRSTNRIGHRHVARSVDFMRELAAQGRLNEVRLDDLADAAGLSKYHFLRAFDRFVGMTPGQYLRTLRLCRGARMLRDTDRSVAEIAQALGFADHTSFSRSFRRMFGVPPTAYRRAAAGRSLVRARPQVPSPKAVGGC